MNRFQNILVAFDGSEDSCQALKTAETLAKDNLAHLTVAYVHHTTLESHTSQNTASPRDILSKTYAGPGPVPTRPVPHKASYGQQHINEEAPNQVISNAKNTVSKGLNIQYEILVGKPAKELIVFAKDNKHDLIVIGNRGVHGIKKFVMGSVSQKVTDQATCPVLVVK